MRVTIYLTERDGERLDELAEAEHRTMRQQATVLVLKALDQLIPAQTEQRETVAA